MSPVQTFESIEQVSAAGSGRGRLLRLWVVDPVVRGLTGFVLALVAFPVSLCGGGERVGRAQWRLAQRFSGSAKNASPVRSVRRPGIGRVLAHSVLVLAPSFLAFVAAALAVVTVFSGYLYPLRPDTIAALGHPLTPDREVLPEAWGGPTLVGAWLVHAGVAAGIQIVCVVVLRGLITVQNRLTRWLLGG